MVKNDEMAKMLELEGNELAQIEWASPIVLAPKKDGTLRFREGYRELNAVAVRDSYPIPRMEECIDSLRDPTIFSNLAANSG